MNSSSRTNVLLYHSFSFKDLTQFLFTFFKDFGISTGLAARLDGMSIENLGGFHDNSDEDDGEFDIKQSSREDINILANSNNFQSTFEQFKADTDVDVERKQRSSLLANAAEKYECCINILIRFIL